MVRTRRRTGNRTFPKRATLWLPFDISMAFTTAGGRIESGDMLGNYFGQTGEEVPIGTTIGPVRGKMSLTPNVITASNITTKMEAVMQLNKEGGRLVAATPGVDIMDGMWYGQMYVPFAEHEISAGTFGADGVGNLDFSTKAKRKITGNGQVLVVTGVLNVNDDYNWNAIGVIMLMLP